MKRVFVGGTNDGERLDDMGGIQAIAVVKKQWPQVYCGDLSKLPCVEQEEYRRELISGDKELFVIYVERSMHIDTALSRLITGYKSNTGAERR